jgi:hypothetical protein
MNFLVIFCSGAYCLQLHRLGSELVHVSFAQFIVIIYNFCVIILAYLFMDQPYTHIYTRTCPLLRKDMTWPFFYGCWVV